MEEYLEVIRKEKLNIRCTSDLSDFRQQRQLKDRQNPSSEFSASKKEIFS